MNVKLIIAVLLAVCCGPIGQAANEALDVYAIDVEGGKALLVVSPSGESLLFDAGWPASNTRKASTARIVDAVKAAGLKKIDYLVISHYDTDHIGDVPDLVSAFPIGHIVDHGPANTVGKGIEQRYANYSTVYKSVPHIEVKVGDKIPIKGVDVEVVTAKGKVLTRALKGGGAPNVLCAKYPRQPEIPQDAEDNNSIGLVFTLGRFRMIDLADLEGFKNHELVCPNNLIGTVDVYQVNVHGQFKGMAAELVGALRPRVAVMGNGARKGGDKETWPILRATPGVEDIWQVHFAVNGGKENNPPEDFIANLEQPDDEFQMIKLSARPDGTFIVTNTRNGFSKTYKLKQ
jgi:beta-lactamase superfamily II metal-dependent hydrolase